MKKFLLVGLVAVTLSACGGGSDGTSSSGGGSADSQIFGSSISGGSNDYSISGIATGCKSVGSNGTCSVQITYTGAGTRAGNVGLSPTTGYASTTATSCTPASATENQCTFNITNNGSAAQSLIITLGGTATTSMFTFGQ